MTKCPRKTMIFHREFPIRLDFIVKNRISTGFKPCCFVDAKPWFYLPWRDFLSKIALFSGKFVTIPYTLNKNQFLTKSACYSQTVKSHGFMNIAIMQFFISYKKHQNNRCKLMKNIDISKTTKISWVQTVKNHGFCTCVKHIVYRPV